MCWLGGGFIYVSVWVGEQGMGIIFFLVFAVFLLLLIILSWLVHDVLPVSLFLFCFLCLPILLIRCYQCIETAVCVFQSYFKCQVSDHYSVDFLEKRRVLWFQLLLREFRLLVKFVISACWFVIPIHYLLNLFIYLLLLWELLSVEKLIVLWNNQLWYLS